MNMINEYNLTINVYLLIYILYINALFFPKAQTGKMYYVNRNVFKYFHFRGNSFYDIKTKFTYD